MAARIRFSVPKPPSYQDRRDRPEDTLAWINKRVRELISAFEQRTDGRFSLDYGAYSVIYTTVHDFSRSYRGGSGAPPGEQAYRDLVEILRCHCKDLRTKIMQSHLDSADRDLAVMQSYAAEWSRYRALAKLITHLFGDVDKHWVRREIDQGKPGICRIRDIHSRLWKEEVVIGSSQRDQGIGSSNEDGFESILDIAVRFQGRNDSSPDLVNEIFASFDESGIRGVGTWEPDHSHDPDGSHKADRKKLKHETLASGLEITHLV